MVAFDIDTGTCVGSESKVYEKLDRAIGELNERVRMRILTIDDGSETLCWRGADIQVRIASAGKDTVGLTSFQYETCMSVCEVRWINRAYITIEEDASYHVVMHELLHAVGLGHTCLIPSAMATRFSEREMRDCSALRAATGHGGRLVLERSLSTYDVVAVRVLRTLADTLRLIGERSLVWAVLDPDERD